MVADAVAWLCRSPRRLAAAAALGLAAVVVVVGLVDGDAPARTAAGPAATPTAAAGPATTPDAAPFVTAAVDFARAWGVRAEGESQARWHRRVAPLATPDLAAVLKLTAADAVVQAQPVGTPEVRYVASGSALVAVPMDDGSSVAVTVVTEGTGMLVADVQPDVGDLGDVGGESDGGGPGETGDGGGRQGRDDARGRP